MTTARGLVLSAMATAMLALLGCNGAGDDPGAGAHGAGCRTLAADPAWSGDNCGRISGMLRELGTCGKSGSVANGAPLALFD